MNLADLVPDPEALIALEPDELGLRMLPVLVSWPRHELLELRAFLNAVLGHPQALPGSPAAMSLYPAQYKSQIEEAFTSGRRKAASPNRIANTPREAVVHRFRAMMALIVSERVSHGPPYEPTRSNEHRRGASSAC